MAPVYEDPTCTEKYFSFMNFVADFKDGPLIFSELLLTFCMIIVGYDVMLSLEHMELYTAQSMAVKCRFVYGLLT